MARRPPQWQGARLMVAAVWHEDLEIGFLPGNRLDLRHGPIHLVIGANGAPEDIKRAYRAAVQVMDGLLGSLAAELPILRRPISKSATRPQHPVAVSMWEITRNVAAGHFATPMIAVAGAVADHVLAAMLNAADLERAYVNNGGDIALHLASDAQYQIAAITNPNDPSTSIEITLTADDRIGGIATSGWRGRSHSLGIADSVTVLAETAAHADCAATLIANAIDCGPHPRVQRAPAEMLSPDSDLGERLVTIAVGDLAEPDVIKALKKGRHLAEELTSRGVIRAAYGRLQSCTFSVFGDELANGRDRKLTAGLRIFENA
ncbi:MAG: UPF0280 family protein [Pseudomonadota bacterium]